MYSWIKRGRSLSFAAHKENNNWGLSGQKDIFSWAETTRAKMDSTRWIVWNKTRTDWCWMLSSCEHSEHRRLRSCQTHVRQKSIKDKKMILFWQGELGLSGQAWGSRQRERQQREDWGGASPFSPGPAIYSDGTRPARSPGTRSWSELLCLDRGSWWVELGRVNVPLFLTPFFSPARCWLTKPKSDVTRVAHLILYEKAVIVCLVCVKSKALHIHGQRGMLGMQWYSGSWHLKSARTCSLWEMWGCLCPYSKCE